MAISRRRWGARGNVPQDGAKKRELFLHHTVSSGTKRTRAQERAHMRQLEAGHINQGWSTIGYSYILFRSGRLYVGRGFRGLPAAQGGHNTGTVAIACVGNYDTHGLSRAQRLRLRSTAIWLRSRGVRTVGAHREAPGQATSCPGRHIVEFIPRLVKRTGLRRYR